MRASSLGTSQVIARRYHPRPVPARIEPGPIIEYTDTRADVLQSRIVLAISIALALGAICFNVVFFINY